MPTLYRKYRPQNFKDVTGQDPIVQTLGNEVAMNKIAHAYIFSGPRGVGKTTLARIMAKAVNCTGRKEKESEPCNKCPACDAVSNNKSIDVIEIDAASHTGVDNVRENIIETAGFAPTTSKYKVFIIDEVHMLSTSAFNALLKTLEEPPAHVIFVLATTELADLPATVVSRCQRFQFKKIPHDIMLERLEKLCESEEVKVDKKVLERVIGKSDGCLRDAESLLGQLLSLNLKKIALEDAELILPASDIDKVLEFTGCLLAYDAGSALKLIAKISEDGVNFDQFALDLVELLRTILIASFDVKTLENSAIFSGEHIKKIKELLKNTNSKTISELIDMAMVRRLQIRTSPLPQLPLELLAVEWCNRKNNAPGTSVGVETHNYASLQPNDQMISKSEDAIIKTTDQPTTKPEHQGIATTIKQAITHITHRSELKTTLEDFKNRWMELMDKLPEANQTLNVILRMCRPEKIDRDKLYITVPYSLHKDKLEEPKNRKVIESCLSELFGENILLVCSVLKESEQPSDLGALALEFGGEVVN